MTSNDAGWGHIPVAAFELPVNRASKAVTGADKMPTAQQHSIGKPLGISKLKKPRAVRGVSRRHQAPERAITLAAARRPSQVVRFFFDPGKQEVGTVNAALVRIVKGPG